MENLDIYNAVRVVPGEAQRKITGGRLNGKTDINPMWRIKTLTEQFGVCGFGWKYEITDKRIVTTDSGEAAAFVDINLYIKVENAWSDAIPGTGGSAFIAKEKSGLNVSDECFKMALTDAISVACKALGVGADVYWEKDSTKYDKTPNGEPTPPKPTKEQNTPNKVADEEKLRILGIIDTFIQTEQKKDKKPEGVINAFILGTSYEPKKQELTDYTLGKYGLTSLDELSYQQLQEVLYQTNVKAGKIK